MKIKRVAERGFGAPLPVFMGSEQVLVYNNGDSPLARHAISSILTIERDSIIRENARQTAKRHGICSVSEISVCVLRAYARCMGLTPATKTDYDDLYGANVLGTDLHETIMTRLTEQQTSIGLKCIDWRTRIYTEADIAAIHHECQQKKVNLLEFECPVSRELYGGKIMRGHIDVIFWPYGNPNNHDFLVGMKGKEEEEEKEKGEGEKCPVPVILDIKTTTTYKFNNSSIKNEYLSQLVFYAMMLRLTPEQMMGGHLIIYNVFKDTAPYNPSKAFETLSDEMVRQTYRQNVKKLKILNGWFANKTPLIECPPTLSGGSSNCRYYCWFTDCQNNCVKTDAIKSLEQSLKNVKKENNPKKKEEGGNHVS